MVCSKDNELLDTADKAYSWACTNAKTNKLPI